MATGDEFELTHTPYNRPFFNGFSRVDHMMIAFSRQPNIETKDVTPLFSFRLTLAVAESLASSHLQAKQKNNQLISNF